MRIKNAWQKKHIHNDNNKPTQHCYRLWKANKPNFSLVHIKWHFYRSIRLSEKKVDGKWQSCRKVPTKIPYIIYDCVNGERSYITFYISSVILLNQIIPKFKKSKGYEYTISHISGLFWIWSFSYNWHERTFGLVVFWCLFRNRKRWRKYNQNPYFQRARHHCRPLYRY